MSRVSSCIPSSENSFQTRVPTGNDQRFMSLVSTVAPSGSAIQRALLAPSDQSSKAGSKPRTPGASVRATRSA
jgi:hypothetical protein